MARRQNPGKKTNLSQFGLLDVDLDDGDHDMDLSDDDMDFEAELAAISGEGARPKPRKPAPVPVQNLDAMIAASLQDVPSDDEDVSGDEDDPDLLNELQELGISDSPSPPPRAAPRSARAPPGNAGIIIVIQERISNYMLAEKQAKAKGESSRARRFARGLKTLNELLKQAQSGKPISTEEVPPPVVLGKPEPSQPAPAPPVTEDPPPALPPSAPAPVLRPSTPPPSAPAPVLRPSPPPPSVSAPVLRPSPPPPAPPPRSTSMEQPQDITPSPEQPKSASELTPERQQGLQLILSRKREFTAAALSSKQAGDKWLALEYLKVVKQFELVVAAYQAGTEMDLAELPSLEAVTRQLRTQREDDSTQQSTEPTPAPAPAPALVTAGSVDEALKQRLAYFQQQEAKAKEEGNSSKARRMGRITKQYVDAIKAAAAGRAFDAGELPTPPGYAALPDGNPPAPAAPAPSRPAPRPAPAPAPEPAPKPSNSRYEKQILFLLQRQKQFKEAAIKAKKEGNIEQAKEYLRAAKGFDSVLEAARGGLPVDLKSLPLPPTAKNDLDHTFEEVSAEDCGPSPSTPISSSDDDVIARLHQQLTNQLKLCLSNREHNSKMGNVAEANRFDHIAVSVKQDLDLVAVAKGLGETPKFHYESRKFSVVQCNTDLNENDLELTIVRGIAYNVPNPKEIDTYVRFEFPYPQDAPVSDRTATVKDTNSPVYNAVFPLAIQRGARACQRVFKRHALKLEIYSKGGWFRSDVLLGTVSVKMAPLEQQVTIHDSFPLMEGRRAAGGSLEVKLRVRTPLLAQHVDTTTHRWLVIDN